MKIVSFISIALLLLLAGCGEAGDYAKVATAELLPVVASILTGVLSVIGAWLVKLLKDKANIDLAESQKVWLAEIISMAVGKAEQFALTKLKADGELPSGAEKMQEAIRFVRAQADAFGLPQKAEDELVDLLEAALGVTKLGQEIVDQEDLEVLPHLEPAGNA